MGVKYPFMKYVIRILFVLFVASLLTSCHALSRRYYVGKNNIEQYLKRCIGDSLYSATLNREIPKGERKIESKKEAAKLVEPILFEKYGKERIINQKPYEIRMVNGFWVIKGTILKKSVGGTFSVVIDSGSGNIEKIYHSK